MARIHHIAIPMASRSFQSCSDARFVPKSIFVRRHRTKAHSDIVLLPSCGHHGTTQDRLGALLRHCRKWHFCCKNQYESAHFSLHNLRGFQSRPDDCFMPKCVFCTTSSIRSHLDERIVYIVLPTQTNLKPPGTARQKIGLCDVIEREPLFFFAVRNICHHCTYIR